MILIWFTYNPNLEILDEVQKAGHECLHAKSEIVLRQLAAQYLESLIVIDQDIPQGSSQRLQQQYTTLVLKPGVTAKDLVTEIDLITGSQKPVN